jgi:hypothetical protein
MLSQFRTWLDSAIRRDLWKGPLPVQVSSTLERAAPSQGTEMGVLGRLAVTRYDPFQLSDFVWEPLPLERRMIGIAPYEIVLRALGCWT